MSIYFRSDGKVFKLPGQLVRFKKGKDIIFLNHSNNIEWRAVFSCSVGVRSSALCGAENSTNGKRGPIRRKCYHPPSRESKSVTRWAGVHLDATDSGEFLANSVRAWRLSSQCWDHRPVDA